MASAQEAARTQAGHTGKVLVVEDEEPLRRAYGRMLETAGFTAVLAASGREAMEVIAFEALARTLEPSIPYPGVLFSVAEQLGRVQEVGRAIRASVARTLEEQQPEHDIFINLHPSDLLDEALFSPESPISPFARQIVLEITERAALDGGADIPGRIRKLRSLGFRVAIDDLGAGYAGLSYFALLTPDVVKLDIPGAQYPP